MIKRFVVAALAFAGVAISSPAAAQGACSRELLEGIAGDWVSAVEKGTPFELNLGEWVDYQENLEIGFLSAFFDRPRRVEWYRAFFDTTGCRVFVASVAFDDQRPLVLSSALTNGFFGVSPINNVVTAEGDWRFDAGATLEHLRAQDWSPIPEGRRASRAELIAAADAYLDRFADASATVPWGPSCVRMDGGVLSEACDAGLPEGVAAIERQYTVDEVLGAVNVLAQLGDDRLASSHTLRVEDGAIRWVHSAVNCGDRENCELG